MAEPDDQEVSALFDLLKQRYGDRLTADELDEVHQGVELIVGTAEELRSFRLDNGVGPVTTFTPYRGED